jgi:hypothetical protein
MAFFVCIMPKRVRIHDADCSYCRQGNGRDPRHKRIRAGVSALAPIWTGPFETLAEAREKAGGYSVVTSGLCRRCLRRKLFKDTTRVDGAI